MGFQYGFDKQRQCDGQKRNAEPVQRLVRAVALFCHEARHHQRDQHAQRQVEEENPAPTQAGADDAAEARPQRHGNSGCHTGDTEGASPRFCGRKGGGDRRETPGHKESRGGALCGAGDQKKEAVPGKAAGEGCYQKPDVAGEEGVSLAEAIGDGTRDEEGRGEGDAVGVDNPGPLRRMDAERRADRRQDDYDRCHVKIRQGGGEAEGDRSQAGPTRPGIVLNSVLHGLEMSCKQHHGK